MYATRYGDIAVVMLPVRGPEVNKIICSSLRALNDFMLGIGAPLVGRWAYTKMKWFGTEITFYTMEG